MCYIWKITPYSQVVEALRRIYKIGFQLPDDTPNSPDLAPSDYYLFPKLKKPLKGKGFSVKSLYAVEQFIADMKNNLFMYHSVRILYAQ